MLYHLCVDVCMVIYFRYVGVWLMGAVLCMAAIQFIWRELLCRQLLAYIVVVENDEGIEA